MPRLCPDCVNTELTATQHADITIDFCPKCAGVWFDEGELSAIAKSGAAHFAEIDERFHPALAIQSSPTKSKGCPVCQKAMDQYRYMYDSPVTLDSCPACGGIWTQNGDLEAMSRFVADKLKEDLDPTIHSRLVIAEGMVAHETFLARHRQFQRVARVFSISRARPF